MKPKKQPVAMASIDYIIPKNQGNSYILYARLLCFIFLCFICIVPTDPLHSQFKCDFCPITFDTEDNFNAHVLEHFVKRNCLNCNKLLIRIGSKWYELHVDETDDHDHKDDLELDAIAQINVEKLDDELEFTSSNDHDIILDSKVSDAFSSSDSNAESHEKIEMAKSKKRKRSAAKPKSQPKHDENETAKTTQRRRKGPLPRIKCRICERIILKYNFDVHLQKMHVPNVIVTKEPVKCETCGKGFANSGNLKIHRAIHTGTKRFGMSIFHFIVILFYKFYFLFLVTVCSYCGTSFRQLYHLTEHINSHTGVTPYACKVCNKRFSRHTILKAHQRVHTGEKPHICEIDGCDRAYAYEIDLKRHKFSAHGIYSKKHICSFCEKVFPEKKLLRKHLESHSAGTIRVPSKNNE